MSTRARARRNGPARLFLALSTAGAAACAALSEDPHERGGAKGAMHADAGSDPHRGAARTRCSICHDDGERAQPRFRERAIGVGHDVRLLLEERSTCTCCHLGEVRGFGEPIDATCLECHDDVKVTIPAMASQHCLSCHDLARMGGTHLKESAWECRKCHAGAQGERAGIDVHGGTECVDCHRPHEEPWTLPRACADCHGARTPRHGPPGPDANGDPKAGPTGCEHCHAPHETASEASARCAACHAERRAELVAKATFRGHDACTTCHAPHRFDRASARPCASCHRERHTMTGRGAAEHAMCTTCHDPHDAKRDPSSSCASCHASVRAEHPGAQGKGCAACHDPHPDKADSPTTAACSSAPCHAAAHRDTGFHAARVGCTDCHAPHDFRGAVAPPCATCHAREAKIAAQNQGHAACSKCHAAHAPGAAVPACGVCHQPQAASAPAGHLDCKRCHDVHDGSRDPKAACARCHAAQTIGPHGRGMKQGCETCHRAHGPDGPASPPACATCHAAPARLGGLHTSKGHDDCARCHTVHAAPKSDRATCLACHHEQQHHEPAAKQCGGCHGFARSR